MNQTILQPGYQATDHSDNHAGEHSRKQKDVLRLADIDTAALAGILSRYGLRLKTISTGETIPGSFWGDEEAGLIGNELLVRADTPLHSVLHEACHYVCMDKTRREGLHTDAGGDYDEENAVCYLQILLADQFKQPGIEQTGIEQAGRQRMFKDMDLWGYTFRLGSAQAWFEKDADEARMFLLNLGLIDQRDQPTFKLREL